MLKIIRDFKIAKEHVWKIANRLNSSSVDAESNKQATQIESSVAKILDDISNSFDRTAKVLELTEQFDKQKLDSLSTPTKGFFAQLEIEQQKAIELAVSRVKAFNQSCLPQDTQFACPGGQISVVYKPIESVGLYIPGGQAPLLSTLIMTASLAQIAGCSRIVVCSPPSIHPFIKAVADYLNIPELFQLGGVQAIAAMAYGLDELPAVDKIFGPGNQYVTAAKKMLLGTVGIDALYGPSELLIIADKNANPKLVAGDLMSQLEHGSGFEAACLLTDSLSFAEECEKEFEELLGSQTRAEQIKKAWNNFGIIAALNNLEECVELSNVFAPEHLELKVQNYAELLPKINNAGAVFVASSNEALGDYLAGPSHCLPTGRSARFSSGLSVYDFMKKINVVDLKPDPKLLKATALLARMEGLEAHAQSALNYL